MIRCSVHGLKGWTPEIPSAMPSRSASARVARRPSTSSRAASAKVTWRRVRYSISEAISSPARRSRSDSSAVAIMSSKRLVSAREAGSRSWYSSSIPTVKSVDSSKRPRTPSSMPPAGTEPSAIRRRGYNGPSRPAHGGGRDGALARSWACWRRIRLRRRQDELSGEIGDDDAHDDHRGRSGAGREREDDGEQHGGEGQP